MANEVQQKGKEPKVAFVHSLAFKFTALIFVIVLAIISVLETTSSIASVNALEDVYHNYTQDVAEAAATSVDAMMEGRANALSGGLDGPQTENNRISFLLNDPDGYRQEMFDTFNETLGGITLKGVEGSYAYMVSADGTMVYHPTVDKIGNPVENDAVKNLVSQLQSGKTPEQIGSGSVVYMFKGAKKYAGYAFTAGGNMVIVTGDYDVVMAPIRKMQTNSILIATACIVAALVLLYIVIKLMLRPIHDVGEIITKTADLDFRKTANGDKLAKRKDEIGLMAKAVSQMRRNLRGIINRLMDTSGLIGNDMADLEASSTDVNNKCTDNSATTEELAATMQEAAATVEHINGNIQDMQAEAQKINELAKNGEKFSEEVMGRAEQLHRTTEESTDSTRHIYENVKVKADSALEGAKAVDKINELTNSIMEISDQTSLLALNASIEAARAGEAGRGFAVVAGEIGNLAKQTTEAVANINSIVGDVIDAVRNMSDCLNETNNFIGDTVLTDYENFAKVSEQYQQDADAFKDSMLQIREGVGSLDSQINEVTGSIGGISESVTDSANAISDIAGKTSDIVNGTGTTSEKVDECRECVSDLEGIVKEFRLQ